jgi:two-component system response regulator HydG
LREVNRRDFSRWGFLGFKRAIVFGSSGQLGVELVRELNARGYSVHGFERKAIDITLQHTRGDKNMAARLLGIATRTIYRHIERQDSQEDETSYVDSDAPSEAEGSALKVQ